MDISILGIQKLTEDDKKKLQVIHNCHDLGIPLPDGLQEFEKEHIEIAGCYSGVFKIEDFEFIKEWQSEEDEECYGGEIIVSKIPPIIEKIRIFIG